jgi:hypothetical protein
MVIVVIGKLLASDEFQLIFYPTTSIRRTLRNGAEMECKQNVIDWL